MKGPRTCGIKVSDIVVGFFPMKVSLCNSLGRFREEKNQTALEEEFDLEDLKNDLCLFGFGRLERHLFDGIARRLGIDGGVIRGIIDIEGA